MLRCCIIYLIIFFWLIFFTRCFRLIFFSDYFHYISFLLSLMIISFMPTFDIADVNNVYFLPLSLLFSDGLIFSFIYIIIMIIFYFLSFFISFRYSSWSRHRRHQCYRSLFHFDADFSFTLSSFRRHYFLSDVILLLMPLFDYFHISDFRFHFRFDTPHYFIRQRHAAVFDDSAPPPFSFRFCHDYLPRFRWWCFRRYVIFVTSPRLIRWCFSPAIFFLSLCCHLLISLISDAFFFFHFFFICCLFSLLLIFIYLLIIFLSFYFRRHFRHWRAQKDIYALFHVSFDVGFIFFFFHVIFITIFIFWFLIDIDYLPFHFDCWLSFFFHATAHIFHYLRHYYHWCRRWLMITLRHIFITFHFRCCYYFYAMLILLIFAILMLIFHDFAVYARRHAAAATTMPPLDCHYFHVDWFHFLRFSSPLIISLISPSPLFSLIRWWCHCHDAIFAIRWLRFSFAAALFSIIFIFFYWFAAAYHRHFLSFFFWCWFMPMMLIILLCLMLDAFRHFRFSLTSPLIFDIYFFHFFHCFVSWWLFFLSMMLIIYAIVDDYLRFLSFIFAD